MATVGENGCPYVQYRGGPKGFLKVINKTTLGFADFRGNMQYIIAGNINANRKASLFLIDYPSRQRLKIWAESKVVEADSKNKGFYKSPDRGVSWTKQNSYISSYPFYFQRTFAFNYIFP